MSNTSNNKRVLKNTLFLYCRMFITMIVALYTSRVMLQYLGVDDYGLRNVVAGVIAMLGFITNTMANASTRFFSCSLVNNNNDDSVRVFQATTTIYVFLIIIVVLLLETIGLWFVENRLNIPEGRELATFWVFQFAILTTCSSLIRVPYNASIIAHEHMNFFAYVSILEVTLQLIVVYFLTITQFDRLIFISILYFIVSLIVSSVYYFYCKNKFYECQFKIRNDKDRIKEIFDFVGWNVFSSMGNVALDQGINILLNLFFGTSVNAARAIAYQVKSQIIAFATNFQIAAGPQITKYYASNNLKEMHNLTFQSSKFSFFLLLIIASPVYVGTDWILTIWLGAVPEYSAIFVRLLMVNVLIDGLAGTLNIGIQATANIKSYSIYLTVFKLICFFIGYLMFNFVGCTPEYSLYITIMYSVISVVLQVTHSNKLTGIKWRLYINKVMKYDMLVFMATFVFVSGICWLSQETKSYTVMIIVTGSAFFIPIIFSYFLGCTKSERMIVSKMIFSKIYKR